MKSFLQNTIYYLSVLALVFVMIFFSIKIYENRDLEGVSMDTLSSDSTERTMETVEPTYPSEDRLATTTPIEKDYDYESLSEELNKESSESLPIPPSSSELEVQPLGKIYELKKPRGDRIGSSGLLPGTRIAIIKKKTKNTVKFDACTVAFSLPGQGKYPWAITAGHCGKPGDKVYTIPSSGVFSDARFLGTIRRSSKSNYTTGDADWAAIRLNPKAIIPPAPKDVPMRLDTERRKKGSNACKEGATTGRNCGKLGSQNLKITLGSFSGSGEESTGRMDQVNLCALPGDSGGPVFDKRGIIGIISSTGASKDDVEKGICEKDSTAFFVPISDILEQIEKRVKDIDIPKEKEKQK